MKDQMTVGRTVRLKRFKLIPGMGSVSVMIPKDGLYKILKVNNDNTLQVECVRPSDKTALGKRTWPISDFALVNEA